MWQELISELTRKVTYPFEIAYAAGAREEQLTALGNALGVVLPEDLATLLRESNGVRDQYGLHIIWSTEEIEQYNHEMCSLEIYAEMYMSFTDMLFFADAENGDRFAFPILQGKVKATSVFAWDHEDDSRTIVAFSLRSYLERLLSGKIKL